MSCFLSDSIWYSTFDWYRTNNLILMYDYVWYALFCSVKRWSSLIPVGRCLCSSCLLAADTPIQVIPCFPSESSQNLRPNQHGWRQCQDDGESHWPGKVKWALERAPHRNTGISQREAANIFLFHAAGGFSGWRSVVCSLPNCVGLNGLFDLIICFQTEDIVSRAKWNELNPDKESPNLEIRLASCF